MMHGRCTPTPWRGKMSFFSFWRLVAHCVLNLIVFWKSLFQMHCKSMTLCFMLANLEAIRPEWSFPKKNGKSNVRSDLPEFIDLKSQPKPLPSFGRKGIQHGSSWPYGKVWWTSWRQWVVALSLGELRASFGGDRSIGLCSTRLAVVAVSLCHAFVWGVSTVWELFRAVMRNTINEDLAQAGWTPHSMITVCFCVDGRRHFWTIPINL